MGPTWLSSSRCTPEGVSNRECSVSAGLRRAQSVDSEGQLWSEPQKRSEDEQEGGENSSNRNNPMLALIVHDHPPCDQLCDTGHFLAV